MYTSSSQHRPGELATEQGSDEDDMQFILEDGEADEMIAVIGAQADMERSQWTLANSVFCCIQDHAQVDGFI